MRMRDGTGRGDRYMLMTFEEFPQCIKVFSKLINSTTQEKRIEIILYF